MRMSLAIWAGSTGGRPCGLREIDEPDLGGSTVRILEGAVGEEGLEDGVGDLLLGRGLVAVLDVDDLAGHIWLLRAVAAAMTRVRDA